MRLDGSVDPRGGVWRGGTASACRGLHEGVELVILLEYIQMICSATVPPPLDRLLCACDHMVQRIRVAGLTGQPSFLGGIEP